MSKEHSYIATLSKTNDRPGFCVIFRHPMNFSNGKPGLRMRRGLGTKDEEKAKTLVNQLNQLLLDKFWWPKDKEPDALKLFDPLIVKMFYYRVNSIGKQMNTAIDIGGPQDPPFIGYKYLNLDQDAYYSWLDSIAVLCYPNLVRITVNPFIGRMLQVIAKDYFNVFTTKAVRSQGKLGVLYGALVCEDPLLPNYCLQFKYDHMEEANVKEFSLTIVRGKGIEERFVELWGAFEAHRIDVSRTVYEQIQHSEIFDRAPINRKNPGYRGIIFGVPLYVAYVLSARMVRLSKNLRIRE